MRFPSRLLFKVTADCPRLTQSPAIDGDLSEWADVPALPDLSAIDSRPSFAEIKVAYDKGGLYLALVVVKDKPVMVNRSKPLEGDNLQVFVDTRATQEVHRATRFCHSFVLWPKGGGSYRESAMARQRPMPNAREQTPLCSPNDIPVAARGTNRGYTLEVALPAAILNGFEPEAGHEMGFNYLLTDAALGQQFWSAPPGFAYDRDPSLWGLLRLA